MLLSHSPLVWAVEPPLELGRVSLQLKWTHSFQFAGYYAAKELGFYRQLGLDVEILEAYPNQNTDPVEQVISNKAQYGVGSSSLLLSRHAGKPVVALAVIFQHSPLVLISRQDSANQSIHSLAGKRLMLEPHADELLAYLRLSGISPEQLTVLPHSFNTTDLVEGHTDAISAYISHEPYYLTQAGLPIQIYTPRASGIDFYGDNLFTSEHELHNYPDRVHAFREASLKGWQYALQHPEEIAQLIQDKYTQEHSLDFYRYQAFQMGFLLQSELIGLGYMHAGRWQHIAQVYADLGLLPQNFDLDGFLYESKILSPDPTWIYLGTPLALLAYGLALYTWNINRQLKSSLEHSIEAERALRLSEERYRLVADNAGDVIWTLNLAGHCTYVSPSILKLRGYTATEALQQQLDLLLCSDPQSPSRIMLNQALAQLNAGQGGDNLRLELRQICQDGNSIWTETTCSNMFNQTGQPVGLLCITRNITERRHIEAQLRHMARHDQLTGLPNRAFFSEHLQQALTQAHQRQHALAVLFLDFNHFKPINDNYGHEIGDLLLKEAAKRMQNCLIAPDTLSRIGGDEFVILLTEVEDEQKAHQTAQKLHLTLATPFFLQGHVLKTSCSIGIALYPEHGCNELDLCRYADQAMYQKKRDRTDVPSQPM
ncbi:PAS domain S-box-containing protein/diguanylate cyclase (GGDEF)-like protein [Azomonas agilis]|uniref:PAS domain S-box-containing protein/diguanylate cyclase (GGDEF)-like protein n=1 Tax=Azomonas agilis TaxID=116849 RepID=A0A562HYX1_9GAMM|nr:diguanylate cyclase [Azomonas agilis]TWH63960.1 PAS domain S-box-containing protein/diguanylate cyclase (GGDEF)-like protein [Azomonas agilis]